MKIFTIGASLLMLAAQPAFAALCQLSNEEFEALRLSRSQIQNQRQVDMLPDKSQEILCRTRINFKKYHQSQGGLQSVNQIAPLYLSPSEAKEYSDWLDALFRKKMDH